MRYKWSCKVHIVTFKKLSTIEPCKQLWMVACWNWVTLCTNSHDDLTWLQLEGFSFWSMGNPGNRRIFIFRNIEKLGIMLFVFPYGKVYEMQSIKTHIFWTLWKLVCITIYAKSDWYAQIQKAHGSHRSPENQFQSINTFAHNKIRPQCWLKETNIIFTLKTEWS